MMLVYTVCSGKEEAEKIGKLVVEEGLAACTNSWPINSCFLWKGELEESEEVALLVKTREELVSGVFELIKEIHSYETPALLSIPVASVEGDYLKWLNKATDR